MNKIKIKFRVIMIKNKKIQKIPITFWKINKEYSMKITNKIILNN
jgi:hypothetical protein